MKDKNLSSKLVMMINWTLGMIYYGLLNWPKVYYHHPIPQITGIIFVSSHFTMSDSWLFSRLISPFDIFQDLDFVPYNLPDQKNFVLGKRKMPEKFGLLNYVIYPFHVFIGWWIAHSKCIPVNRKTGGLEAHKKVIEIISQRRSNVLLFPESGRRRKGVPIKISSSVGKLVCDAQPKLIIPIRLKGLPYKGSFFPIIFRRPLIIVGNPIEIPELNTALTEGDYRQLIQKIIMTIDSLKPN